MIIFGGWSYLRTDGVGSRSTFFNDIHILNIDTFVWTELQTTGSIPRPRCQCASFIVAGDFDTSPLTYPSSGSTFSSSTSSLLLKESTSFSTSSLPLKEPSSSPSLSDFTAVSLISSCISEEHLFLSSTTAHPSPPSQGYHPPLPLPPLLLLRNLPHWDYPQLLTSSQAIQ